MSVTRQQRKKNHSPAKDTFKVENLSDKSIEQILNIPAAYRVKECSVTLSAKGQMFKMDYTQNATGKMPTEILSFFKMAKMGDEIIFEDINVIKGDRTLKWITKVFVIP